MATSSTATASAQATATTTAAVSLVSIGALRTKPGHAGGDLLFEAVRGGLVVRPSPGLPRAVFLLDPAPRVVVRIVVSGAVPELRRAVVATSAQVRRDCAGHAVAYVFERVPDGGGRAVRLRRR